MMDIQAEISPHGNTSENITQQGRIDAGAGVVAVGGPAWHC